MASTRRGPLDHDLIARVPALRRHLIVSGVGAALAALLIVAQAEVIARTLVSLIDGRTTSLTAPLAALVAIGLARGAITACVEWSGARAMRRTRCDLRDAVVDHATVDASRERPGVAAREANVATSGLDRLDPYVRDYLPALTFAVAVPLAAGARILSVDWVSAAIVAVTVPLIPIFMVLIGQLTERRSRRQWAVLQRLAGHFLDVLEGLPTLRLFGRARAQAASVQRISDEYRTATVSTLRVAFLSALALELLATLSVAVVAVSIGLRLADGNMGLESALIVLLLAPECYLPLRRVGAAFHAAEAGHDAGDDLRAVVDGPVFPSGHDSVDASHGIVVRGLRADDRPVFPEGIDLDLNPGTVTVIRGPSGVGKSTVLAALRGRLPGRAGRVVVGSVDLSAADAVGWADQLTVVSQRPEPLAHTVGEEVRGATEAEPGVAAAWMSDVGLAGSEQHDPALLSGGQLRRVQVARVAVAVSTRQARVVLADEPTAQLDEPNAAAVRDVLVRLARDWDAIVVVATHDPGWSDAADQVIDLRMSAQPASYDDPSAGPAGDLSLENQIGVGRSSSPSVEVRPPGEARGAGQSLVEAATADPDLTLATADRRWAQLRELVRPLRSRMALAAALAVLAEVCTLGLAGAAAWLIVRASEQPPLAALAIAVTGIRAFGIGKGVLRYAERLASHDVGFRLLGTVRAALVDRLADVAPVPGWRRGDLLRRAVNDVDRLLDLIVRIVVPWTALAVTSLGAVAIMVVLDSGAGLTVAVAAVIVGVGLPAIAVRCERRLGPDLTAAHSELTDRMLHLTERIDLLVGAGMLRRARRSVDEATEQVERLEWMRATERMATRAVVAAMPACAVAAVFAVVGTTPSVSAPVLGIVILWPLAIVELLSTVSDGARTVPELATSADRVDQLLALRREPAATSLAPGANPPVELSGLVARWPGAASGLGPYSITVPAGGRVTVSGPSGTGKSTLAAAMVRFCPTVAGRYEIASQDARIANADDVRTAVLWIDQHPWIGDSSVRENLKIGDPTATDDRLRDVLGIVELNRWVAGLPAGLDTRVGRGGHAVSGGEAHRIALARALLAGHPIVVLDEPVSHLDPEMGDRVLAAVDDQVGDRSLVVLGHGPRAARPGRSYAGNDGETIRLD